MKQTVFTLNVFNFNYDLLTFREPRDTQFDCRESETWQCLLCTNMSSMAESITVVEKRTRQGLDPAEQTLMERILLELYCQYEPSLHFREIVSHDVSIKIFFLTGYIK